MKVLFLDSPSFGKEDMIESFEKLGYGIIKYYDDGVHDLNNAKVEGELDEILSNDDVSFVFSFNWYPLLSNCCERHNKKYLGFVYDSPYKALFSTAILNECNYVFLFDKSMFNLLRNGGVNTVYYMPMMANVERTDKIVIPTSDLAKVSSDVSFVGSMYDEDLKHNLYDRMEKNLDEYTKGYLRGLIEAQLKIQGCSIVEECLSDDIIKAMQKAMPYKNREDGVETLKYIYAKYFIDYKITSIERSRLLKAVSDKFDFKIYTHNKPKNLPNAKFMGAIDWKESMPAVFKYSKINLNITLRSILSGMPLRVFDIFGAGGFLISNYQEDFFDYFVPGEDFVYYEDQEDLLAKIEYYLTHDNERCEIARNSYEKVKQAHTYYHRAVEMLSVAEVKYM